LTLPAIAALGFCSVFKVQGRDGARAPTFAQWR